VKREVEACGKFQNNGGQEPRWRRVAAEEVRGVTTRLWESRREEIGPVNKREGLEKRKLLCAWGGGKEEKEGDTTRNTGGMLGHKEGVGKVAR